MLLLFSCNNSDHETSPESANKKDTIPQKESLTGIPKFAAEIPLEAAATLIRNHRATRLNQPTTPTRNQDTRFIDFPIAELARYLIYAKDSIKANGVRVYLGTYPDTPSVKYPNALTVMFIPTLNGKDIIIDPAKNILMQVLDEGQLCPPPYPNCINGGAILMNTADRMSPADAKKYTIQLIPLLQKK